MRNYLMKFMMILLSVLFVFKGNAQEKLSGRVLDRNSNPIEGVTITVKGTKSIFKTDEKGYFTLIDVPNDSELIFSSVGYISQTIIISSEKNIEVFLEEDSSEIDEIVVVGYGTQKKSDLTGAVASVKSDILQQRPAINAEQQLAGKIAGVNVSTNSGRPGGQTKINIRGFNSINASNDPLYVIDGVIGAGPIGNINANDIESMEVLKDASSTAIYGARGANGVIIVTTKKGSKNKGQVNYDSFYSLGKIAKKLEVLNSQEFLEVELNAYKNVQKYDPVGFASGKYTDPLTKRKNSLLFDSNGNPLYDTDWQDEVTRNAISNNHNLSFYGGENNTTYGISLNYANENGILLESYLKKYSGRIVLENQIKPWLKVGGTLNVNNIKENRVDGAVGALNVTRMMVESIPMAPVKHLDGTYGGNIDYPGLENGENPVNILKNRSDVFSISKTIGNIYSDLSIAKNLILRSTLGVNINNTRENFYSGRNLRLLSADQSGVAQVFNSNQNYWQFENYINYSKKINDSNSFDAMAGLGWQEFRNFNSFSGTEGFLDDFYQSNNLGVGSRPSNPGSGTYKWNMNSYFGRVNYQLLNKYLFTVTGRLDGSSKFGNKNKYAFFPSAAAAWKISDETFMQSVQPYISNLKIRTSYGSTGNSEIGVFQSLASMSSSTAIFNNERAPGIGIGTLANPDLQWERTDQFDVGLELGLFKNRLNIETDIYYKNTSNMLLNAPVPTTSGFTNIYKNIGSMVNKGVEVSLNSRNIEKENFNWITNFNISFNKNKVTALGEANDDILANPYFLSNTNIIRVGEPVGSFFGYIREGIWGTQEEAEAAKYNLLPGDVKLKDTNKDGQINAEDRLIIGKGIPDFFGTLSNTIYYKNFDFTVELQFSKGNDILNMSKSTGEDRISQVNSYATVLDAWTPENQGTAVAEHRPASSYYTMNVDTRWVEDGSFIRGKNILLGYTFNDPFTSKLKLQKLKLYATIQNFFLATKYSGYDPEVTTYGDAFAQGIEFFGYPKPKTYMIGLNVSF